MARIRRLQPSLVAALTCALLLVCAVSAQAETYGELGHFGSTGSGAGQFKLTGPPTSTTAGTHALGVDPTDNTVYVGDEPRAREYRIQKFTASGQLLASTPLFAPPNRDGIEGIAVDSAKKRIYVLALERRSDTAAIESREPAVGTLYAFSTEQQGETLVPASGTNAGVLTSALESQSDAPEGALLFPKGITVDPTTHEVIVLGEVALGVPKEGEPLQLRVALQRIHLDGTLGARYVDGTDFFSGEGIPNSPVVTPGGSVYIEQSNDVLAQIPSDFASASPPSAFLTFTPKGTGEPDSIAEFDTGEPTPDGGAMALAAAGAGEGTVYAEGHIFDAVGGKSFYPGVLAFDATHGAEIGWTGGQVPKAGSEASCNIGFSGVTYPVIAAGSGRILFVLDAKTSHVIEFGPEGHGCPAAQATAPGAVIAGSPLLAGETIAPGTPVTFSSTLTQANALSVEWSFGDGTSETVSSDEYQHTQVTHAFARGGQLTVTETIHTDDLATPTIVEQTSVSVSSTATPPTAVLEGPLELTLGAGAPQRLVYLEGGGLGLESQGGGTGAALATFDGSASFDPNPPGANQIKAYHWVFGDGSEETSADPTVTHSYDSAGAFRVELTVTDASGLTSEPSVLTVKVKAPPAPPSPPVQLVQGVGEAPPPAAAVQPPSHPPVSVAVPAAGLAGRSLLVGPSGTVRLIVTCPAGESRCEGTVILRTLGPVSVRASRSHARRGKSKSSIVMLAGGSFTVGGGHQRSLVLHLTAPARALLARTRQVHARATLMAHDGAGAAHTTELTVLMHASSGHVKKLLPPGR
jgi:PKD repeat protein